MGHKLEFIKGIADLAQKEHSIRMTLDSTEHDLDQCIIKAMYYQGSYLLAEIESDILVMKECLLKANSI